MLPASQINRNQRTFEEFAPAVARLLTTAISLRLAAHSRLKFCFRVRMQLVVTVSTLEAYPLRFVTKTSASGVHRLTNILALQNF